MHYNNTVGCSINISNNTPAFYLGQPERPLYFCIFVELLYSCFCFFLFGFVLFCFVWRIVYCALRISYDYCRKTHRVRVRGYGRLQRVAVKGCEIVSTVNLAYSHTTFHSRPDRFALGICGPIATPDSNTEFYSENDFDKKIPTHGQHFFQRHPFNRIRDLAASFDFQACSAYKRRTCLAASVPI